MTKKSPDTGGAFTSGEEIGNILLMMSYNSPALFEGKVLKVVFKFSGVDCFMVVTRWNPEESRQEVTFVGSHDITAVLRKFRELGRERALQWKVDRFG